MKEIPEYPGYLATENGIIYSIRSGTIIKLAQRKHKGYMHVSVKRDDDTGKRWKEPVHKLVLLAYSGERLSEQVCRHLNGNPLDNRIENLKWGTVKENAQDSIRHGTAVCLRTGEQHIASKLKAVDIYDIRKQTLNGKKQSEIAKQYNISQRHVSDIIRNKTWKHLSDGVGR